MANFSGNNTKCLLLIGTVCVIFIWLGHFIAGDVGALLALGVGLVVGVSGYWYADKLVLSQYAAKELSQDDKPMLYAIVAYIAERAKIERPRIFLIDENMPTVFATGRGINQGAIAVTKGLLDNLNKDELAAAIAHGVAHIQHNDTLLATLAAGVGGFITLVANSAQAIFVFGMGTRNKPGNNKLAVFLMSMLAPMVAIIIQMFINKEREFYADEKAAELCENPQHVANALRKIEIAKDKHQLNEVEQNPSSAHLFIVSPLHTKKWKLLFLAHPPIAQRIERLECMILD